MKALEPMLMPSVKATLPSPLPKSSLTGAEATRKKRILLADDSPEIREAVGKLLRRTGYEMAYAAHGGQVLERVVTEHFDLLLLDLNMPEMDGWHALGRLVRLRPALPILVITAQPNQRDWVVNAGARGLMEKPLDVAALLQMIENLLRRPPTAVRLPAAALGRPDRSPFGYPGRSTPGGVLREGLNE